METLRRKIAELEHSNKILEENYKSASQSEKKEILEKLAISEVKEAEFQNQLNLKDDEIQTLKKEIDDLRERIRVAYNEKEIQAEELESKIASFQAGKDEELRQGEAYWKEELLRSQASCEKLTQDVKFLEGKLQAAMLDARQNENAQKIRIADLERDLQKMPRQDIAKDYEAKLIEYERILQDKEAQRQKQKNEWAEIYGNLRQEIEDLKNDITVLNNENDKLLKQLEITDRTYSLNKENEKELITKLKKRDEECNSLWDALKDMFNKKEETFDLRHVMEILSLRALDKKAREKFNLTF